MLLLFSVGLYFPADNKRRLTTVKVYFRMTPVKPIFSKNREFQNQTSETGFG